jgi:hypothetical protein
VTSERRKINKWEKPTARPTTFREYSAATLGHPPKVVIEDDFKF